MSDDTAAPEPDDHDGNPAFVQPVGEHESASPAQMDSYDLDDDGKISLIENERARLGIVDARLEEIAAEGGIKGALADAAHKIVDKLDNDG